MCPLVLLTAHQPDAASLGPFTHQQLVLCLWSYPSDFALTTSRLQGEGRAAIASKDLMLGEHLPPLTLLCKDCHGNGVPMADVPAGLTLALKAAAPQGQSAEIAWEASEIDVDVSADVVCTHWTAACNAEWLLVLESVQPALLQSLAHVHYSPDQKSNLMLDRCHGATAATSGRFSNKHYFDSS